MSSVGAYLATKSWNPRNMKTQEDIFKQEQLKKEEAKKVEELRREYQDERNREELEALQVKAGLKPVSRALGWMYDTPGPPVSLSNANKVEALNEKEREAFLVGDKSLKDVMKSDNVSRVSKKARLGGGMKEEGVPVMSKAELFVRMREDPMFLVKKAGVDGAVTQHQEKKRNKHGKEKKESKKSKKKHRRHRSDSSISSSSSSSSETSEDTRERRKERKAARKERERHSYEKRDDL